MRPCNSAKQPGIPHIFVIVILVIVASFWVTGVSLGKGLAEKRYLDELIDSALEKRLYEQRHWHLLLHYKKSVFGGYESLEDGPQFFNTPLGKTNPKAELIATIKSFFQESASLKPGEEHPQCNFPARYKWLNAMLSFNPKNLQQQDCARLDSWLKELAPQRVTIVFSSFYLNNPASMFGHTLLRIDKNRTGTQQKLLNYGVNYSANVDDTSNGLLFALKGLFGFFQGTFTVFPYYTKVQQYTNLESRDLWEYELNFTENQIDYLLKHLWELGGNYFDYFYFQENCSYHILSILEVANPDLKLTDEFWFHVIPSDTIKAITRYEDLVSEKIYRPSLLSQMNHKRRQFSSNQEKIFRQIVRNPQSIEKNRFKNLTDPEKALVLDTFLDFAQYENMKNGGDDLNNITIKNRATLLARSKLRDNGSDSVQTEFSTRPELGHGSDRLKIGYGEFEGEGFEEIAYRPAYHDLLARDTGFGRGSQILFLDVTARYYNGIDAFKLDRLQLIDIVSLTPYDSLFKKKSWRFAIGVDTIKDFDCNFCNTFKTAYGLGLNYRPDYFSPLSVYGLVDLEFELGNNLESDYRVGGGGTLGLFYDLTEDWRVQVKANIIDFPVGHDSDYYKIAVNQRYALSQNLDLRLELERLDDKDTWLFSFNAYF